MSHLDCLEFCEITTVTQKIMGLFLDFKLTQQLYLPPPHSTNYTVLHLFKDKYRNGEHSCIVFNVTEKAFRVSIKHISHFRYISLYFFWPGLKKLVPISTELIFYPRLKWRFRTKAEVSLPGGQWVFPEIAIWKWPARCILSASCIRFGSKVCPHLRTFLLWLLQSWWEQMQLSSKNITADPALSIL